MAPPVRASIARNVAHGVLVRVARDNAYADRALDAALERTPLKAEDRAFATELVYGTLRHQQYLDFLLSRIATRPLRDLQPAVLTALRMGAHQIVHLRVPSYSAVNESVALVAVRSKHAKGFANAVLRKLAALAASSELPDAATAFTDPVEALSVTGSHPLWLVRRWVAQLGLDAARQLVEINNQAPVVHLRANRVRTTRAALVDKLTTAGLSARGLEAFPEAVEIKHSGNVTRLPGFEEGLFVVQDAAAQLVGYLLDPKAGETILDACAAPGGKATHAAELMGDDGLVLAVDIHPGRTRLIAQTAQRLGLRSVHTSAHDSSDVTALAEALAQHKRKVADRVLVDAPCSGLGTLRRNPELRARYEAELPHLCQVQDALLDSCAEFVAPGGVLVYAVCTVTQEEGPGRVQAFLRRHADFHAESPSDPILDPFLTLQPEGYLAMQTWPHRHGCDGFFAARLRRAAR